MIFSQSGTISFSVGNSVIELNQEGQLRIQSDVVKIDGQKVFINSYKVSEASTKELNEEEEDAVLGAYLSNEVYNERSAESGSTYLYL